MADGKRSPEAMQRRQEAANARITEHRLRVSAYKVRTQCADCVPGVLWPACALQLDHRPDEVKYRDVSKMLQHPWERIAEEIAKCDCVCASHHAMRTAARRVPLGP